MRINKEKKCVEIFNAHWYLAPNGEYYPSVTSVLQTINKGYGYEEWLKSVGHNSKIIVEKAQKSGSKIHDAIERFLLGNKLEPLEFDEDEWVKMCNFANWANNLDLEVIETETELFSENMRIAGTADLVCRINGTVYLIDYKSGNNIYSTSHLQVGAYVGMWNASHEVKIERAGLLHVGANVKTQKDLNNKGIKFEETEIEKSQKLFKHTLAIYDEMFRKNPPMLEYPCELEFRGAKNDN
jgi:hypothetical protein